MISAVSIQVRIHADKAALVQRAARIKKVKLARFVREAAVDAAITVLKHEPVRKAS
jgi:uncharacterized protein (DUF1778 family)